MTAVSFGTDVQKPQAVRMTTLLGRALRARILGGKTKCQESKVALMPRKNREKC
jgi:hypothetical protein